MRVVVTGGAGFIGSNFIRALLRGKIWPREISKVLVLDSLTYAGNLRNLEHSRKDARLEFKEVDICDIDQIREELKNYEVVVNFAAESHVDQSIKNPDKFARTNFLGTQILLNACLENSVKTFIQISTDEVYGTITEGSWDEHHNLLPNSPYSATKAAADLLCLSYYKTYGLDVRITRCCNNYGPWQNIEKVIPLFITNLIQDKKIPVYGTGKNIREWIHVEDHCDAILRVMHGGKSGEIYNIGSGFEITNIELADVILKKLGKNSSLIEWVEDRKGHDFRYSLDSSKIHRELGFVPKHNLEKDISEIITWYALNSDWWLKK
jgi:dTDP-glucose 4,6-dehydratase